MLALDPLTPGSGEAAGEHLLEDFIKRSTRLLRPPRVSEVQLWLADEITPMWQLTERELGDLGIEPPYWAFAWAGGQAVARHVLDHPELVRGRHVLDVAAGSGLCGIAAALAGAELVTCVDLDPLAGAAIALNAEHGGVADRVHARVSDLRQEPPPQAEVILAGDVCYDPDMTAAFLPWLRAAAGHGSLVILGDPGRDYFPKTGHHVLARYDVPTTADLEGRPICLTSVVQLADSSAGSE